MAKNFSILYVTSEISPYAKVGPLADIAYSLPLAIRDIGHDIRVMLPKYGTVSERKNKIHDINRLKDMPIPVAGSMVPATVKSTSITNPRVKVQAYVTTNVNYLDMSKGIYYDIKNMLPFPNNDERFIFYNKTVIETCLLLGWVPDIIHVNDWATALIPAFAKVLFPNKFRKTKIVLTIHNFSEQGVFDESSFEKTGLPEEVKSQFMHNGKLNFLKGAISFSDYINTISPTYAQEILQDEKYSDGLNQMLVERADKFSGISCAFDLWVWHPKFDENVFEKFTGDAEDYKLINRNKLLESIEIPLQPEKAVVSFIPDYYDGESLDLFINSAEEILKEDIILLFMGDCKQEAKSALKKIAKKYSKKFFPKFAYEEQFHHRMMAGSDICLMPSLHEPSALNAVFALANGTAPVARITGAVNDLAIDYNPDEKSGNSFLFSGFTHEEFVSAVKRALNVFAKKNEWLELCKKNMNSDYSWENSAKKYDEIYRLLMKD